MEEFDVITKEISDAIEDLSSDMPERQGRGYNIIAHIPWNPRGAKPLIDALAIGNVEVQNAVMIGLHAYPFEAEPAIDRIIEILDTTNEPFIMNVSVSLLGQIGTSRVADILYNRLLNSEHHDLFRRNLVSALGKCGAQAAHYLDALRKIAMFDESETLRATAVNVVEKICTEVRQSYSSFREDRPAPDLITFSATGEVLNAELKALPSGFGKVIDERVAFDCPIMFPGVSGLGEFRLRIYRSNNGKLSILMSYDELSFGKSITNGADMFASLICKRYGIDDGSSVDWINHYPLGEFAKDEKNISRVKFHWDTNNIPSLPRWIFISTDSISPIKPEELYESVPVPLEARKIAFDSRRSKIEQLRVQEMKIPLVPPPSRSNKFTEHVKAILFEKATEQTETVYSQNYGDCLDERPQASSVYDTMIVLPEDVMRDDRNYISTTEANQHTAFEWHGPDDDIILRLGFLEKDVIKQVYDENIFTNVPWTVFGGSIGYAWGYTGSGPHELALNIINMYVPPETDGLISVNGSDVWFMPKCVNNSSYTSRDLHHDFVMEILSKIPHTGGRLSGKRVQDWILSKLPEMKSRIDPENCLHQ